MTAKQPKLIFILGLPGTGKSTLAAGLAASLGIRHLNTDMVREQEGLRGKYTEDDKKMIYDRMLELAGEALRAGHSVIVDGTFYRKELRDPYTQLASDTGAAVYCIQLQAAKEVVKDRVAAKRKYSEADFSVYQKVARDFEPLQMECLTLRSDRNQPEELLSQAIKYLRS